MSSKYYKRVTCAEILRETHAKSRKYKFELASLEFVIKSSTKMVFPIKEAKKRFGENYFITNIKEISEEEFENEKRTI